MPAVPAEPGKGWYTHERPTLEDWTVGRRTHGRQPLTDMQALMETAPHEEVPASVLSGMALRERLAEAVDSLDDRVRWVFESYHYRGMSFRAIGKELSLSKSHAHRLYMEAICSLRKELA